MFYTGTYYSNNYIQVRNELMTITLFRCTNALCVLVFLFCFRPCRDDPLFKELRESFLETMHTTGADFTNTFRALRRLPFPVEDRFSVAMTELVEYILTQCATVDELKKASQPQMDNRY